LTSLHLRLSCRVRPMKSTCVCLFCKKQMTYPTCRLSLARTPMTMLGSHHVWSLLVCCPTQYARPRPFPRMVSASSRHFGKQKLTFFYSIRSLRLLAQRYQLLGCSSARSRRDSRLFRARHRSFARRVLRAWIRAWTRHPAHPRLPEQLSPSRSLPACIPSRPHQRSARLTDQRVARCGIRSLG
jgi:hypothetical protein